MELMALSLFGACLGTLVPEGKGDSMRRLITMILGLAILSTSIEPVITSLSAIRTIPDRLYDLIIPEWDEGERIWEESRAWVEDRGLDNIRRSLSAWLCTRYALSENDVTVELACSRGSGGELTLEQVQLTLQTLPGQTTAEEIARCVADMLGCPCIVATHTGENETEEGADAS